MVTSYLDTSPAVGNFRQLRTLQISGNCISSWDMVGRLDRLQLVEMRMRNTPVNSSCRDEETVKQLVIARISSLQH
jgi:predicted site-specific integrase-resolvase